jgi:uncharacterized membrane protein YgcG
MQARTSRCAPPYVLSPAGVQAGAIVLHSAGGALDPRARTKLTPAQFRVRATRLFHTTVTAAMLPSAAFVCSHCALAVPLLCVCCVLSLCSRCALRLLSLCSRCARLLCVYCVLFVSSHSRCAQAGGRSAGGRSAGSRSAGGRSAGAQERRSAGAQERRSAGAQEYRRIPGGKRSDAKPSAFF